MDYSTLNRLKDKMEQATSAAQVASISVEIEKEERRLKEESNKVIASTEAILAQKELLIEQLKIVQEQNQLLLNTNSKLEEMLNAQIEANKEAKEDLTRSRRFNLVMMIISIVAMIAAIAGPIVTILVSR